MESDLSDRLKCCFKEVFERNSAVESFGEVVKGK